MTDLETMLKEIEERANAASDWKCLQLTHYPKETWGLTLNYSETNGTFFSKEDATFIAHARTDVPRLVAALREAIRQRDSIAGTEFEDEIDFKNDSDDELAAILRGGE